MTDNGDQGDGSRAPASLETPTELYDPMVGEDGEPWTHEDTSPLDEVPPDLVEVPERLAHPDLEVAGRYRFDERVFSGLSVPTWRAFDLKLSRLVLVHVLPRTDPRTEDVIDAVKQASIAADARFIKVLDVLLEPEATYLVVEDLPGKSIHRLLAQGPLSGLEAGWITREVAEAMAPMHERGLFHRRLNPDTVFISNTGSVKIAGFLLEAALNPHSDSVAWSAREVSDVRALGKLFYAMLVSRWPIEQPDEPTYDLPGEMRESYGWRTPRQVLPAVSPALDSACDLMISDRPQQPRPPMTNLVEVDVELTKVLGTAEASADLEHRVRHPQSRPASEQTVATLVASGHAPHPAADPTHPPYPATAVAPPLTGMPPAPMGGLAPNQRHPRPPRQRRWLIVLIGAVALTLIAGLLATAINNGLRGGRGDPSAQATPGPVAIAGVDDFDPEADGGNGEENPGQLKAAIDGKPDTAWVTLTYLNRPTLGGLKPGVGVVVDLGKPVAVSKVKLTLVGQPTSVQLMAPAKAGATAPPMRSVKDWQTLAKQDACPSTCVLTPTAPPTTRYLLVYLTKLPQIEKAKYRGGIAEIGVES